MAGKQLVVKAVLQYPEGLELGTSPDIRRFKVARENADDKRDLYCRLVDSLGTVFPDITGVNFSLYWKDGEGDLVQFSSPEELQAAIDAMTNHVLRVYVIVHFDEIEDTTEAETDGQSDSEKKSKRVRFARAGRKFRRKIRRRRRAALSDPGVISKEYRTGARALIHGLHHTGKDGEDSPQHGNALLADMAPDVRAFIQQINEEWHSKLATKRPTVVARRMRMKTRTLPPSLERDHFLWLLRLLGRWHRRHAGQCPAMSGWSSGDTDADESGGEEKMLKSVRKQKRRQRLARRHCGSKGDNAEGGAAVGEEEETEEESEQPKVARQFRQAVRLLMRQMHKSKEGKPADDKEKATLAALKPEVHSFILKLADDWHAMLAEKKPTVVAKRMRKRKTSLPADLQRDYFLWLCRYFRRWHSRHATLCSVMSGWSSGEDDDHVSEDETETEEKAEEKEKGKAKKEKKGRKKREASASSGSDSEDGKKKKPVPKEFVKATRILVNRLHNRKTRKGDNPSEEETTLSTLSPETQTFIQRFAEDWEKKLAKKSPLVVAKRMRRRKRNLPAGVEEAHVHFLCRFLSRWHSKHAAFCEPMGAWSSAETGGEASGDERASLKRRARKAALLEASTESEQEDTDCVETACKPVSKEFRTGVRNWLNQSHKKPSPGSKKQDEKEKITLSPEVQQFLQRFTEEWHTKLASGNPRAASREMKAQERSISLPSRMEREQYTWLCCFLARWHRKHADQCDVITGGEMAVQG